MRNRQTWKTMLAVVGITAGLAFIGTATADDEPDQGGVKVGVLTCQVEGGFGYIFGSSRAMDCVFAKGADKPDEYYTGTIKKYGIDIGFRRKGTIFWGVFAPSFDTAEGALAGNYGGASGEASIGAGVGANVLIGGSSNTFSLQPVSVVGFTGLNVAGGIASMSLEPSDAPKNSRASR